MGSGFSGLLGHDCVDSTDGSGAGVVADGTGYGRGAATGGGGRREGVGSG